MPTIKILPHAEYAPEGKTISAPAGTSICEALLDNGVNIEHACDMSCACTTCHVVVREGFKSLGELDEAEEDLLTRAVTINPDAEDLLIPTLLLRSSPPLLSSPHALSAQIAPAITAKVQIGNINA